MRDNKLFENISKLNTIIHMIKSNELLSLYIEKITNNRSKNLKFVNDFDYISLDLLYTSLQIMNSSENIKPEEYNKLDKRELKYYLDKIKGINYFKNQVPAIRDIETLITYLIKSLSTGSYICNNNNTVKFENGLIIDSDWLVEFAHFLVTSFNNNINLSNDGLVYSFNNVTFPKIETNKLFIKENKNFIKNIRLYEYSAKRKDGKRLSFDNIKYLINTLSTIDEYDFKELKSINAKLAGDGFTLSVNKKNPLFNKEQRKQIEKLLNEEGFDNIVQEYVKNILKCYNSETSIRKRELINSYELLLDLSRAYKCNYTLNECRKLFNLNQYKEEIDNAFAIADFYINYVYDENNLDKYFNYSLLTLEELKPSVIDYETPEYKEIINKLSALNKKTVVTNRKINKYLNNARRISKTDKSALEENSNAVYRNCRELEKTLAEIRALREELEEAKDENHKSNNINKTKIKYIKESIIAGTYSYDPETSLLTFNVYSKRDYHRAFCLEISLSDFKKILLSDTNKNLRINFYQI